MSGHGNDNEQEEGKKAPEGLRSVRGCPVGRWSLPTMRNVDGKLEVIFAFAIGVALSYLLAN